MKADNQFFGSLSKYSQQDFVAIIDSKFGWAVSEQANDILNGQLYEDQNENALKYIQKVAEEKGEKELAESINDYLCVVK
jgi:hypothetical protein